MKNIISIAFLLFSSIAFGQVRGPDSSGVYYIVERMPEYPGGEDTLLKFMKNEIRYPQYEFDHNIQGRVVVGFTVNEYGHIEDIKIKKAVSPGLDSEAMRVMKLLSNFKPAMHDGKAVRVSYILPVKFTLKNAPQPKKPGINYKYIIWIGSALYFIFLMFLKRYLANKRKQKENIES